MRPLICEVKRSEIARPAASSFALLMRRPEDKRCREVAKAGWRMSTVYAERSATSAFVLITSAMKV